MTRPGVTYQDIAAAANELKGRGKSITIDNVRTVLGTGSIGTINNHLRKWKEAQHSTNKIAVKEHIPEELVALVKGLWERICTQSIEQFTPVEENYQQEITALKEEAEKYKTNNQRWQKLYEQWLAEKNVLAQEKLTLEQAIDFAQRENVSLHAKQDGLLQQLQDKQERIDELHRLHTQAQKNLEHYRESAREQRLLDQQQHEQQKQQLQSEIKILHEQLIIQREETFLIQQKHQTIQHSFSILEENHTQTQSRLKQLAIKLEETEKFKNKNLQDCQHWKNQYKDSQTLLSERTNQFIDAQAEVKMLGQQVTEIKIELSSIQNQNKLLSHERWELAQEKAQLEGQLSQIQKSLVK